MSVSLEEKIALAERAIGTSIQDRMLVLEALQTSGNHIRWNQRLISVRKNDNLAVLGDVVMKVILCEAWYETGRPKGESMRKLAVQHLLKEVSGQWTTAEQATICNANLSRIGFDNGLDKAIILNPGTVRATEKLMSTTVEALVGAAFIEGRLDAARKAITALGIDHEFLHAVTLTHSLAFPEEIHTYPVIG